MQDVDASRIRRELDEVQAVAELTVTLPEPVREFLEEKVALGQYSSASEFLEALLREAQAREKLDNLETLLREAIEAGPPIDATPAYWEEKRRELVPSDSVAARRVELLELLEEGMAESRRGESRPFDIAEVKAEVRRRLARAAD